jgi:hypothetical protein
MTNVAKTSREALLLQAIHVLQRSEACLLQRCMQPAACGDFMKSWLPEASISLRVIRCCCLPLLQELTVHTYAAAKDGTCGR